MLNFLKVDYNLERELNVVASLICEEINLWASNYNELVFNQINVVTDPLFIEKTPKICCDKLMHLLYLINGWESFVLHYFSSFLHFESYRLIHEYNISYKKRIMPHINLKETPIGTKINSVLAISDFFVFVNLKDDEKQQSVYDVRAVVESTMFDLFSSYLRFAINKLINLKEITKEFINSNKCRLDKNSLKFTLNKVNHVDILLNKVLRQNNDDPEQFKDLFNLQIDWVARHIVAGDILYLTFGVANAWEKHANEPNKLLFPLEISASGKYKWLTNDKMFGFDDTEYFGVHVDPGFSEENFFYNFIIRNSLYQLNKNKFVDELAKSREELQFYTKPTFTKRNLFLFNPGFTAFSSRPHSKKISEYSNQQPIELFLEDLEFFLQKKVIVMIGSHLSINDEQNKVVGPFFLEDLLKLKEKYYNLHIIYNIEHNNCTLPYVLADRITSGMGPIPVYSSLINASELDNQTRATILQKEVTPLFHKDKKTNAVTLDQHAQGKLNYLAPAANNDLDENLDLGIKESNEKLKCLIL